MSESRIWTLLSHPLIDFITSVILSFIFLPFFKLQIDMLRCDLWANLHHFLSWYINRCKWSDPLSCELALSVVPLTITVTVLMYKWIIKKVTWGTRCTPTAFQYLSNFSNWVFGKLWWDQQVYSSRLVQRSISKKKNNNRRILSTSIE